MKKTLLVLVLTVGTLVSKAQTKVKIDLEDGLGNIIPMTFIIQDTNLINNYLKNIDLISPSLDGTKTDIKMFIGLSNISLKFKMNNRISYKLIQSPLNEIRYNIDENRLEIILIAGGKNGYGNFIEGNHMVAFSNDSNYILGKVIF
jgi:hypothetical protein